jgi:DNA helicase-2/ATP-dependent DNA helicase PcrA
MDPATHSDRAPTGGPAAPRLVFFDVQSRRDLAQRAAAAAPGVRFASRRDWTDDPGEPRRGLRGGDPAIGLWHWRGTLQEFEAQATEVLLRLVHPLIARGLPFCMGFPFSPEAFEPRRLAVGEAARLDLEDIGRLLRAEAGADPHATPDRATRAHRRPAVSRPGGGPDAVRLDDAQRAAVEHAHGPARLLAPAGSGKTKTLISRVVELVDRGVDPAAILMLAFNRKAAEQLEERLAALGIPSTRRLGAPTGGDRSPSGLPARRRRAAASTAADHRPSAHPSPPAGRPPGVHCATFNAFGYRYQREVLRARIQLDHDGRSLRPLMARAMETAGISLRELKPRRGSDPVGAFLQGLTRVRAALEPPDDVQVRIESLGETPLLDVPFGPTHTQFARAQAATGVQSFDDQIYFAVADMLADPSHRAFVQSRFDHVLVDEFQDLNGAQLALVDVLSRPHRRLFVVGDDDQLIYGWRQADPRGILEFHRRMPPKPWSATYTLCTNYRCSRAVVETGARLVANNVVREAKDIRPRAGAQDGEVRFIGAPSWPGRAAEISGFLRAEKERLGCRWRDLAVLCRYRTQHLLVALALDAAEIPRSPELGCTLFTHPAARLLRSYLHLVSEPDELSGPVLARLLNRPNRYVTGKVAESVMSAARPWSRVRTLAAEESAPGPRPLSTLVAQAEGVAAGLATPGVSAEPGALRAAGACSSPPCAEGLVWAVVETFGLDVLWAAEADAAAAGDGNGPDGAGPLEVLDSLLLLAEAYPDPGAYRRTWNRLLADEETAAATTDDATAGEESEQDRVVIGTIHAAKGREYDSIVIPDYDCDVSRWSAAEVEEERRVVYVGVTRARDAALFTVDTSTGFVHPFLRELVDAPDPGEHETLRAWLAEESGAPVRERIRARLAEIEVLFPEFVPEEQEPPAAAAAATDATAATAAAAAPAAPRSASPSAPCPVAGTGAGPPAAPGPSPCAAGAGAGARPNSAARTSR